MISNSFDKPRVVEWSVLVSRHDTDSGSAAHLSPRDVDFFASATDDTAVLPHSTGELPSRSAFYWLVSAVANILLFIILAMIFFPPTLRPLTLEGTFSDRLGDQLETFTLDEGSLNPTEAPEFSMQTPTDTRLDDIVVILREERDFLDDVPAPFFDPSRIELSELLTGRTDPGTKNDLLAKYGGTQETREAVRRGLAWLVRQQRHDGSWSLAGPFRDGISEKTMDTPNAATALALLALQGDGNTRWFGEHKASVREGWTWLLKQQGEDGSFFAGGPSVNRFYTQAVCTLALAELLGMERLDGRGEELRAVAQRGVDYLVRHQNREQGGWRYELGIESDLSVTGWVLMTLKTAQGAKLFVPSETFDRITLFLNSVAYDGGAQYIYRREEPDRRPSMTATGLLCREYLGWKRNDERLLAGAEILTQPEHLVRYEPLPRNKTSGRNGQNTGVNREDRPLAFYTNVYGWYSAAMMLKHLGPYNTYWRRWNKAMSQEMPAQQVAEGADEAGSWNPDLDHYRSGGGRLYVTALSILCLEVYYRHLSLYAHP